MSRHEFTAGEELDSDKLNKNIIAGSYDAGETVAGATLPVPAYQDTSDNEFYKCDANDTDKLEFVGFIISDGNDGDAVDIQFNGIVKGFTGLDEGEKYYVQDAVGTIGKIIGTNKVIVGIAISTTELLILKQPQIYTGDLGSNLSGLLSSTQDLTLSIDVGFKPRYFEAIINSDICGGNLWSSSSSSNVFLQTILVKGMILGNIFYIISQKSAGGVTPNISPSLNPYGDEDRGINAGTYDNGTCSVPGTAEMTPVAYTSKLKFKNITLSGNTITFTWTYTQGDVNSEIRYAVRQLTVWE